MKIVIPETSPDYDHRLVIERPDGFYWQDTTSGREYGPFATLLEASEDMQYNAEAEFGPGGSLREIEDDLGVADWVDPETGVLAEASVPHIEDN